VALDQEKACDKIEYDYLWKALASYGILDEFIINTVNALGPGAQGFRYKNSNYVVCGQRILSPLSGF
jgi:hypothetical protein